MNLLTDIEGLLHKVEMSQICLADMIHDCKTEAEADMRTRFEAKYSWMHELEVCLRAWRDRIYDGPLKGEHCGVTAVAVLDEMRE